ncbi:MAG: bifunctional methylenetetrahydrofolate dehydrogenase/methenyltetrahydrofolate cyclohydrolase FolD [Cetobacterium sp.]|uniref:bifunctional methylenetetrahydrofolate dehydrogenase/methenyltetrahydrofolate cyclohydrolase FolD n=1 Tax=unclassified Cetobacterium TaxID=2630983 RepID=UPI00163CDEE1|nr:bifunctional methylenetetrahydrofolate dehydrogenase/methenyltetrahydrofolate cyclohydrolase FolD [Cetobacterium sp. 2A]MBC2856604.1 bifunctional methylenetetrahydrofolate dehydrogenase/methenyltetrahydrofolate cyclohydrolase FolD [Cetobacterium sp. 2A]
MQILDGKKTSEEIRMKLKKEVESLKEKTGRVPGLAVIQVGNNSASQIYVNSKVKHCTELGMESEKYQLGEECSEEYLLNLIEELNNNEGINGILVQLPLPKHINDKKIIEKISIDKDVDGFKPENLGKVFLGDPDALVSCTPLGVLTLMTHYGIELEGKDVVIVGRSNIVGKPMAALLINEGATVTVCNSRTKKLSEKTSKADILIVAVGNSKFIKKEMVKEGAIVIDVGISREIDGKLSGDVDFENVKDKTSFITPVPGGIGPMTIAMLMSNTMKAFKKSIGI